MKDNKKQQKQQKKQMIAGAIALFLALLMILGSIAPFLMNVMGAEPSSEYQVEMQVDFGFSGLYKVGYPTPVKAVLTNKGKPFKGEFIINVGVGTDYYSNVNKIAEYAYEVDLPENASKEIYLDVSIENIIGSMNAAKCALKDEKGNTVLEESIFSTAISPETETGIVLSDNTINLAHLKNTPLDLEVSQYYFDTKLIFSNPYDFPEKYELLKTFNYVFITDFDTSRLNDLQLNAIETWVNNGGMLVIGTGNGFNKVMKGLSGIIDAEMVSEEKILNINELFKSILVTDVIYNYDPAYAEKYYDRGGYAYSPQQVPPQALSGDEILDQFENPDEVSLYDYLYLKRPNIAKKEQKEFTDGIHITKFNLLNDVPTRRLGLFLVQDRGLGKIAVAEFDMMMQASQHNELISGLISFLFTFEKPNMSYYYQNNNYIVNNYIMTLIPVEENNASFIIIAIVFVYCIVIGPVLYLILKRKDKREMGLILIPAISLILTGAIYLFSFTTIYKRPVLNSVAKADILNGESKTMLSSNISALTADKGDIELSIKGGSISPKLMLDTYYDYYRSAGQKKTKEVVIAKILQGADSAITYYDNKSWNANAFYTSEEIDMGGAVEVNISVINGYIEGEIINNTTIDFEDIILNLSGELVHGIGTLKAGEKVTLGIGKDINLGYWSQGSYFYNLLGGYYVDSKSIKDIWQSNMRRNLMDYNFDYDYKYGYNPFLYGAEENKGRIYFFTSDKLGSADISLNGKMPIDYTNTLLKMEFNYNIVYSGEFEIDFGELSISRIMTSKGYEHYDYDAKYIYMNSNDSVEIIFSIPEKDSINWFQFSNFIADSSNPNLLEAQIYNNEENEWEEMLFSGYSDQVSRYINDVGEIKIRIINQGADQCGTPQISVKGVK